MVYCPGTCISGFSKSNLNKFSDGNNVHRSILSYGSINIIAHTGIFNSQVIYEFLNILYRNKTKTKKMHVNIDEVETGSRMLNPISIRKQI